MQLPDLHRHNRKRLKRPASRAGRNQRRGAVTLEFILCLPVLIILIVAAVQYSTDMVVRQAVSQAAVEGARQLGKRASAADAVAAVEEILAVHGLTVAAGSGVRVVTEDGFALQNFGDLTVGSTPPAPGPTVIEARVTISLELTTPPLQNYLNSLGISDFTGKRFQISSQVRKE